MSRIEKTLGKAAKLKDENSSFNELKPLSADNWASPEQSDNFIPSPYLVALNAPMSSIAEEYKKLKAMVIKLTKINEFHNTIAITSALPLEGKSITALNLALALSQAYDHTVLLLDADMRKPTLHKYLNISDKVGLSDCVLHGRDIGEAIIKTGIFKLSLLPAGKPINDPLELLSSDMMRKLINEVKNRYSDRYIIIDAPPLLPYAETSAISSIVDGVIMVVREGVSSEDAVKSALGTIKDSNLFGIVYNCADVSISSHLYYK